ncbi:ankyrin-1-like [Copidosoma floridanum]|uniref:ankyrin-1-like n=1 Tax=Copidosoma floridanum TaxID=29053 RepID=UPI0006C96E22|nr:ankyrin-1-like [Copidosoma floridanum]
MDCEKTSLHQAVRSGDIRLVNEVLQRDPSSVYDRNSAYETPLHLAYNHVNHKKPEQPNNGLPILKLLVDHGADVNALGGGMFASALHMAVARKQVDGVKFLLESRADPNIIDENNCTAMHLAVDESSEDIIQVLLDYKADPNIIDCNGLSPLDRAITSCNKNCATKLLESGAKSNNIYKTLLEICIKHSEQPDSLKYKSFIEHILEYAGKLDVHFSLKAIMYYAESKNHDQYHKDEKKCFFSELVHKQGTNKNDAISESELHLAVRGGEDAKIEALLQEGADVNVKNLFGETPLHLLLKNGISYFSFDSERFNKTAYLLIERGSNLRARNYMNETPFFLAVCDEMTNKKIVNLMLAKMTGLDEKTLIDPYLRRGSGLYISCDVKKPELHELIIASERGYEKVIDRLLDMDRIDEGLTAL